MSVNETYKRDPSSVDLLMAVAVMDDEMKKLLGLLAAARAIEESSISLLLEVTAILAAARNDNDGTPDGG